MAVVFERVDDLGYENTATHKVQVHQKIDTSTSLIQRFLMQANGRVDTLAKKGSGMHYRNQLMLDSIDAECKTKVHIRKCLAHDYELYRSHVLTGKIGINPYARQNARKPICIPTGSVHTFDSSGTTLRCVTCLV